MTDLFKEKNDTIISYQNIYNTQVEEFSCLLSILLSILYSIEKININIDSFFIQIENEILPLINYRLNKHIRNNCSKILTQIIILMPKCEQKKTKSMAYIQILINSIKTEVDATITKNFFENIKKIIECYKGEFLNKDYVNDLFNKCWFFNDNLRKKRNQFIEKQKKIKDNSMKLKNKEKEDDDQYMNKLIQNEIENIENIQIEIGDVIGILLKTHKNQCEQIIGQIIGNIIPSYLNSKNIFEKKIAVYLIDDLIEYIGQEKLSDDIWEMIYHIIIQYVDVDDNSIKQAAVYGIGIFAKYTKNNFNKYGQGLLDSLYKLLLLCINSRNNIHKIDDKEDFLIIFDNIIAALGKIIFNQFNSKIVQDRISELIEKWIINLPIKNDESEYTLQHELMVNLFFYKRELIPINYYSHYFESLAEIYQTKYSNQNIDNQIEQIFNNYIKKEEELTKVLAQIYENSSNDIKKKFNILANLKV